MDVPDRTVSMDGETYQVSSIARIEQGTTLSVESSGPEGEDYRVYVHGVQDGTRVVQDTAYVSANDSGDVSFDTGEFDTGSYVVSIYDTDTGRYYDPQPVVVPAFEVGVSAPGEVVRGESFTVSVTAERIESGASIHKVELVVANDDTTKRVDATESDGEYTASVTLSEAGDYKVYAAVASDEDGPAGNKELIGISDASTVEVTTETSTPTTTSGGSGGNGGTTTTSSTSAPTSTATSPETTESTTKSTSRTTTDPSTTTVTTDGTPSTTTTVADSTAVETSTTVIDTTTTTSSTEDATNATDSPTTTMIEPNDPTTSEGSDGAVGTVPFALLAFLASVVLLVRTKQ